MEERWTERLIVDRTVRCRRFDSDDEDVLVDNLSTRGCMITKAEGQFYQGETVLLELTNGLKVSGEVTWKHGSVSGVAFGTELPEWAVNQLGFRVPPLARTDEVAQQSIATSY